MSALKPIKRPKTAREIAEKTGLSIRTIQRYVAQPRKDYIDEAKARRLKAFTLKNKGLSLKEIGKEMGITPNASAQLIKRYKQLDLNV